MRSVTAARCNSMTTASSFSWVLPAARCITRSTSRTSSSRLAWIGRRVVGARLAQRAYARCIETLTEDAQRPLRGPTRGAARACSPHAGRDRTSASTSRASGSAERARVAEQPARDRVRGQRSAPTRSRGAARGSPRDRVRPHRSRGDRGHGVSRNRRGLHRVCTGPPLDAASRALAGAPDRYCEAGRCGVGGEVLG